MKLSFLPVASKVCRKPHYTSYNPRADLIHLETRNWNPYFSFISRGVSHVFQATKHNNKLALDFFFYAEDPLENGRTLDNFLFNIAVGPCLFPMAVSSAIRSDDLNLSLFYHLLITGTCRSSRSFKRQ